MLGEFGGLGYPVRGHTWQSERNWGYRNYTNEATLTQAYFDLMVKLFPLIDSHGLSAAVYTQTTDVEGEVNGLMTYDRAMVKMDVEKLARMNRGDVPPPPVVKEILPTAKSQAATWRYTTEKPENGWFLSGFQCVRMEGRQVRFWHRRHPGRRYWHDVGEHRYLAAPGVFLAEKPKGEVRLMIHHDEDAEVFINGVLAVTLTGQYHRLSTCRNQFVRRHRVSGPGRTLSRSTAGMQPAASSSMPAGLLEPGK